MVIEHGNGGAVGPGTDGSASTARRSSESGSGSPASRCAGDDGTGQVDLRVMNKCEWSFIFESVAAMANLEPMESAFTGSAEKPIADLTAVLPPCEHSSGKSADSGRKR